MNESFKILIKLTDEKRPKEILIGLVQSAVEVDVAYQEPWSETNDWHAGDDAHTREH